MTILYTPNHDAWYGYLVATFVNETITQSLECCPGCADDKNSPLLHAHECLGLLEKLDFYFHSVRDLLQSKLNDLVDDFATKFPDDEIYDEAGKRVLKSFAREFLINCDPRSIYYSKNLTPEIDSIIKHTAALKEKPMTVKRLARKLVRTDKHKKRLKKYSKQRKIN